MPGQGAHRTKVLERHFLIESARPSNERATFGIASVEPSGVLITVFFTAPRKALSSFFPFFFFLSRSLIVLLLPTKCLFEF